MMNIDKKLKRTLIIVAIALAILLLGGAIFGQRIGTFFTGFITGMVFTLIVGIVAHFWYKNKQNKTF